MFRPLVLFIVLRYLKAKHNNGFVSFIAFSSIIGIALGVLTLITVMSVMNGFDRDIRQKITSMIAPITITSPAKSLTNWQNTAQLLAQAPHITTIAPFINGHAIISHAGLTAPALISGIIPKQEMLMNTTLNQLAAGNLADLRPRKFNIVLGYNLAQQLQLHVGAKIILILPNTNITPLGMIPTFKSFTVVGILAHDTNTIDGTLGLINLTDAQQLYGLEHSVTGFHAMIKNPLDAPIIKQTLQDKFPDYYISDWTEQFGTYFQAVHLEKTMMFILLTLLIVVATFNVVTTLVMVVNDKMAEIAILRTIGATPNFIMLIFLLQGSIIGICGTTLGVIGGLCLSTNLTSLVKYLESCLHIKLLSAQIYFIDYIPVDIWYSDLTKIISITMILSILAAVYPAWRAAKVAPVDALRYE